MSKTASRRVATIFMFALAAAAAPLAAQRTMAPGTGFEELPRVGIGYVSSAPHMYLGVNAFVLPKQFGGWGVYGDFKRSGSSPRNAADLIGSMSVAQADARGDERDFDKRVWWSANAALIRALTPEMMIYFGAGFSHEDVFYRYASRDVTFANFGRYWIFDDQASGDHVNVMGGLFLRMGPHVALQVGAEAQPRGATLGGSYSFAWH